MNYNELAAANFAKKKKIHKPWTLANAPRGAKSADKPQRYEIKSLFLHKLQSLGFVVQWIEQPSPKG